MRLSCPCVGHHSTSGAPLESSAQLRPPLLFLSFACCSGLAENDVASRPSLVMPRLGHDRVAIDAGGEMQLVPATDGGRLLVPHAHLQGRFLIQRCGVHGHRHGQGLTVPGRRLSEWAIGTGNAAEYGAAGMATDFAGQSPANCHFIGRSSFAVSSARPSLPGMCVALASPRRP